MTHRHDNPSPADWESLLSCMLQATREAIADAQRQSKEHHVVTQGKQERTRSTGARYTFFVSDDWEPREQTHVQIHLTSSGGTPQEIAGTILSLVNNQLTLETETPLPETSLKKLTLVEHDAWLLERLQEALLRLQEQGENEAQMGSKLFGFQTLSEGDGTRQAQIASFMPNADQARAIARGMESEVLLVIGPPGTGKTATESALIIEYLLAEKTVLLAAHTNKALDTVMRRLKAYCEQSGNAALVTSHQLVRAGTSLDLADDIYQDITLQGIVNQRLGELTQERDQLQEELSTLRETITQNTAALHVKQTRWKKIRKKWQEDCQQMRQAQTLLEEREQQRLAALERRLVALQEDQDRQQERQGEAERTLQKRTEAVLTAQALREKQEQALLTKKSELVAFRAHSLPVRLLSQLTGRTEQVLLREEQRCQKNLEHAIQALAEQEKCQEVAFLQKSKVTSQMDKLEEEKQQLQRAQRMVTNEEKHRETLTAALQEAENAIEQGDKKLADLEKDLSRLQAFCASRERRLADLANRQQRITLEVIKEARLIGTTLSGITTHPYLRDRLFDAILIDEASMASLPLLLVAAAHATRHIALFGDPNQLAPIIRLTEKKQAQAAAYWLGTDVFSHLQVRLEDADQGTRHAVFLSEQARMHPVIAAPISQLIYGGRLKNRQESERTFLSLAPCPQQALLLIDTGDVDQRKQPGEPKVCQATRPPRGSSKYNLYHVQCVVQLVTMLLPQVSQREPPQIGIITPYSAQKAKIRQTLQEKGLLSLVHVGTVHSFQSVEYPCIIFDTTEGYEVPIRQFISNHWGRNGIPSDATRLLNVAHSRAQDKLIYLANLTYIRQDAHRKKHLLTHLVNTVAEHGYLRSSVLFESTPATEMTVSHS